MTHKHFPFLVLLLLSFSGCTKQPSPEISALPVWITLFDGETFDGWKGYNSEVIPEKWGIEDGAIYVSKEGNAPDKNTGFGRSIMTVDTFDNFELELDYRISYGGNSGIMYHVVESEQYDDDYDTGPEFQIIDDLYFQNKIPAKQLTASNFDVFAPDSLPLNSPLLWNRIKLVYVNGLVEHWVNGKKVLEFTEGSTTWEEAVNNSKWVNGEFPDWSKSKSGHISLQDHGDFVQFRNIRIRPIE